MANLEKLASQESTQQKEINKALTEFSKETNKLKGEIASTNKDLKPRTKEEMEKPLKSGEIMKRAKEYVQINGEAINITTIEMDDASGLLKMKYKAKFGEVEKEISTFFQIVGEENNTYLQFKKSPTAKNDTTAVELFDTNKIAPEEGYRGGNMYDINIVKLPSKGIDIRIAANERRTEEKRIETVKNYELAPEFKDADFDDASLENTKITALKDTKLGKEVTKEESGYSRAVFMKEGEKYREIGKVYFNEKGAVDAKKTLKFQEFKLLGVTMKIAVNTDKNTFNIENIDGLKTQIKTQREILSRYIENSNFGDYTIYKGFNRPKGTERKQTKLLGLKLTEDTYSFKRAGDKDTKTLNFGFTDTNDLKLKDITGKDVDHITIQIEKSNGKKEVRDIKQDLVKKQLNIGPTKGEVVTNQEKPEFEDEPTVLTKDYIYNQNGNLTKLEYHNKKGELLTNIPASKNEKNEWKLGELSETINTENLYKDMKKTLFGKDMNQRLQNLNLLDNDVYGAFTAGLIKKEVQLSERKVVKVLDDEKNGIYKYYKVEQNNEGTPFIFEEDKKLYEDSTDIMNDILKNIDTMEKIENTKLLYKDKKEKVEKKFTQFVGGSGLLPIDTKAKVVFLQDTNKTKAPLTRTFVRGSKTEDIQKFPVTFNIKDTKITANEKRQTISNQEYKTRLEDKKDEGLVLWFDDIE